MSRFVVVISSFLFCLSNITDCQTIDKGDRIQFQNNFNLQRRLNQGTSAIGIELMRRTLDRLTRKSGPSEIVFSLEHLAEDATVFDQFICEAVLSQNGENNAKFLLRSMCNSYQLANRLHNYVESRYAKALSIDRRKQENQEKQREEQQTEKNRKVEQDEDSTKNDKYTVITGDNSTKQAIDDTLDQTMTQEADVKAMFLGGDSAWKLFLAKNLKADVPVENGAPAGRYTVWIQFSIDVNGTVNDIKPLTSYGYGLEEEAVRIIRKSGAWTPAMIKGRAFKSFLKKSITFSVDQ
jgi:hypothetical protein